MKAKRTFLITGTTKGIGYATAQRLHRQGHHIIGVARNKPSLDFPGEIFEVDLSNENATERTFSINAVAPGPTETERFRLKRPKGSEAEQKTLLDIPMDRLAHPSEMAAAITFFLSDEAGFNTGQTLFVDGGGSIGRSMV